MTQTYAITVVTFGSTNVTAMDFAVNPVNFTFAGSPGRRHRDGDRLRAAVALIDHATRGLADADLLHGGPAPAEPTNAKPADVVTMLADRLRQLDRSELPTAEKARLTAALADAFLRAVGVDILDRRLESLQAVLADRPKPRTP